MHTAVQERSHVSPFFIRTLWARSALKLGRNVHLSGLSQSVLLNNVGVLGPWEAQHRAWPATAAWAALEGGCRRAETPPKKNAGAGGGARWP